MSTISSTITAQTQAAQRPAHGHGHRNKVASEIDGKASAGTISAADATALTSALDAIDTSLKSGAAANGSAQGSVRGSATTARLDPSKMKDKIDGLIADQVNGGALTSDQATTLKSLFTQGGKGDRGTAGEPPPGPPPGVGASPDSSGAPSGSLASSTIGAASTSDLLASFIKQLQTTQPSGIGYALSGSTATSSNASALVLDFRS